MFGGFHLTFPERAFNRHPQEIKDARLTPGEPWAKWLRDTLIPFRFGGFPAEMESTNRKGNGSMPLSAMTWQLGVGWPRNKTSTQLSVCFLMFL